MIVILIEILFACVLLTLASIGSITICYEARVWLDRRYNRGSAAESCRFYSRKKRLAWDCLGDGHYMCRKCASYRPATSREEV